MPFVLKECACFAPCFQEIAIIVWIVIIAKLITLKNGSRTGFMRRIYLADSRDLFHRRDLQKETQAQPFSGLPDSTGDGFSKHPKGASASSNTQLTQLDEATLLSMCNPIMTSPVFDPSRHGTDVYEPLVNSLAELVIELGNETAVSLLLHFPTLINGVIRQLASPDRTIRLHCLQCINCLAANGSSLSTLFNCNILPVLKLLLDQVASDEVLDEGLLGAILLCLQFLFDVKDEALFFTAIETGFIATFHGILIKPAFPMRIKHHVIYAVGNLAQHIETDECHQLLLPIIPAVIDVMYSTTVSVIFDDCCWIYHFITSSYNLPTVASIRTHLLEQGVANHVINYLYKLPLASCRPGLYFLRNLTYDEQTALAIHHANSRFVPFLFNSVLVSNLKVREIIYNILQSLSLVDLMLSVLMGHNLRKVIMQGLCTSSTKIVHSSILIWGRLSQSPLVSLDYDVDEIRALDHGLRMSLRTSQDRTLLAGLHLIRCLIEESDGLITEHFIGLDTLTIIHDLTCSPNIELSEMANQLLADYFPSEPP